MTINSPASNSQPVTKMVCPKFSNRYRLVYFKVYRAINEFDSLTPADTFNYHRCFGNIGLTPDSATISAESSLCLASVTKLVTCVAAMQCVERGLIGLDDDISSTLAEFEEPMLLKGFEGSSGKPILEKATMPITLRLALDYSLSHTTSRQSFFSHCWSGVSASSEPRVKKSTLSSVCQLCVELCPRN